MGDTYVSDPVPEPTELGFYRYDGGRQTMIFLLTAIHDPAVFDEYARQWWVIFDNGSMDKCHWGYIEQALSVYKLVKIESDEACSATEDVVELEEVRRAVANVLGYLGRTNNVVNAMIDSGIKFVKQRKDGE